MNFSRTMFRHSLTYAFFVSLICASLSSLGICIPEVSLRFSSVKFSKNIGGDERDRTADPLLARQVLSQLSYAPNDNYCRNFRFSSFFQSVFALSFRSFPLPTSNITLPKWWA